MDPSQLTQSLKSESHRLGFELVGACPAVSPIGYERFCQWLDSGYAGEMAYLQERKSAYQHPQSVLDGAASVLMLGMNYQTKLPVPSLEGTGRIARYAWGTGDYHDLIHRRLKQLKRYAEQIDGSIRARGVVDTAPLLEREFAQLAGIGWQAKNTLVINKHAGSWFLLAALLLNVTLEYDSPVATDHCGTCRACLDACPTDAFVDAHVLDASKCISYLTIEHRSPIPIELRRQMGDWILGCDICQEVCPWNRKAPLSDEPTFDPLEQHNPIQLRELFYLTDDEFRARFRKTPLWRPKRRGILRNAAIAMGNRPARENLESLCHGLSDVEPLVRGACAWALGRHSYEQARSVLIKRLGSETDAIVLEELQQAIDDNAGKST